jgi:hypothetical protein
VANEPKEWTALAEVMTTLTPFAVESRRRILAAAALLLGHEVLAISILEAPVRQPDE